MAEQPGQQSGEPGDITGQAFRDLQQQQADGLPGVPSGGPRKGPDFEGAIDAVHGEKPPKPGSVVAASFSGPKAGEAEDEFIRRGVEDRVRRGMQGGISRIFARVSGGVKLRPPELSHLTSAIASRAANVTVFGQNLTSGLDYALHHKKEIVTNTVQYALTHKGEIVTGAVAGGLGKATVRGVLTGTGGFLVAAAAGAGGGALAGAAKEYFKQRESMQINETEKALIIGGLKNEFRRLQSADRDKIRKAALRGAVIGAIGGLVGAEITDFVANNEWVQEQIAKIKLPEIKLPEVKLPEVKLPEVKLPEIRPPEFKFEGAAPADLPPSQALGLPEVSSPVVAPPEATVAPTAPTVEPPATVEAPAAAPTAVPTPEPTSTPTVSPTASPTGTPIPTETPTPVPTGTPTPEATPEPAAAVQPPAAPKPEMPAAPDALAETPPSAPPAPKVPAPASVPPGTEPAIGQPAVMPPTEPLALVEPAPAELPIPAELSVLPEQIPLPAGSNPWEVTGRTLHDVLGRNPTNAEILQVTKEVCRQSNISVPNWEITGEIDHRNLPVNYKLVFNDPVKKLIAGMKG